MDPRFWEAAGSDFHQNRCFTKGAVAKESEGEEHQKAVPLFYGIYTYLLQWSMTHTHTQTHTHAHMRERCEKKFLRLLPRTSSVFGISSLCKLLVLK